MFSARKIRYVCAHLFSFRFTLLVVTLDAVRFTLIVSMFAFKVKLLD
jgi:hypothetical protein